MFGLQDFEVKEERKKNHEYVMVKPNDEAVVRLISGPVERDAKFKDQIVKRYEVMIFDRASNEVKILSMGRTVLTMIKEIIGKRGNPIKYDIVIRNKDARYPPFRDYSVHPLHDRPLTEHEKIIIREADIPERFIDNGELAFAKAMIVLGAQFRCPGMKGLVMVTNSQNPKHQDDVFGDNYPACLILSVTDDYIVYGREDWDFTLKLDREKAVQYFANRKWVPVKTLIENRDTAYVMCPKHRRLMPRGVLCCQKKTLESDSVSVIFS